jgi:Tol biopolymer transport system component
VNRCVFVLVLAAALLVASTSAQAVEPPGPRLAISLFGDGPGAEDEFSEVITTGPAGEDPLTLLRGSGVGIGDGLSWSADGNRFAFSASGVESTAEGPYGTGWPVVGLTRLDGRAPRVYPEGFLNGGDPVLAPDGRTVVFSRVKLVKILPGRESYLFKVALWSLNSASGSVQRLTRWRVGAFQQPISFLSDGSSVLNELIDRKGRRVVATDLSSGRSARLARLPVDAVEPTYSLDGSRLAYLRDKTKRFNLPRPDRPVTELWVAGADGSGARRVLRVKGYITSPSWDPSGSRIAFVRHPAAEATGALESEPGNEAMAINVDGTCLIRVFADPALTLGDVAWRPGLGREAGPISC